MLGFVLAWLLSHMCDTPTAWVERDPDGAFIPRCGDDDGNVVYLDLT